MSAIRKTSPQAVKRPSAKTMSIGVVLEQLRGEFPDVTVSKIRFLESEGLITPQRTASGYRRFTDEDVERLRYILVTQRDNYLPLKVIREQLEAMDAGKVTAVLSSADSEPMISPDSFRVDANAYLTDADLATQTGAEENTVAELIKAGLLVPDSAGLFCADDVRIVSTAMQLREFGFDVRHLKTLRTAASRQADLIAQVAEPVAKSGKTAARQQADELAQQVSALVVSLHASLVKRELRDQRP
ncbi:zinc-responsive transcriptional regulator [Corynebacterium glaucum]|uniref:Zinc-responsive transcriptional regulator n=1 Tax=Corynebacterium glaucum TaxID=187491 RepID=A0A1Q2HWJ0_9CORY|nr:zinc-responsive transcriptional regulator [Corynebacterium glaucum]WJZ07705.1 zinc-responsive transcriptional regulator [Corynebacterium glaucum]